MKNWRKIMTKTCKDCRFCENKNCARFGIVVNENYKICNDFAERTIINESCQKIKLYD